MTMDPTSLDDLSALMDGELGTEPARFLLRRMEHDPELARTWSRWHLIRACLNGERHAADADPVRIAHAGASEEDAFSRRVLQAVQALPPARRRWARYLGGGAIAASVAAAALILAVPQTTSTDAAVATAPERAVSADARSGLIAAAPVAATRDLAPPPWINSSEPMFLAARPGAANGAFGGGLLQPGYLQQAAYAPDASRSILMRNPEAAGNPPYMIMLVPEQGAAQPQQH
jgi:sigma-E factor negative regulatory protein RseA